MDEIQQWREISHIYSQRYFRFPAYNLALLVSSLKSKRSHIGSKIPDTLMNKRYMVPTHGKSHNACVGTRLLQSAFVLCTVGVLQK